MFTYFDDEFFLVWNSSTYLTIPFTIHKNSENKYPFFAMNEL